MIRSSVLPNTKPAIIATCWTKRFGFLWLQKKVIAVEARQIAVDPTSPLPHFTARVTISDSDNLLQEIEIPYFMPGGKHFLAIQVYTYASNPNMKDPHLRSILLTFCSKQKNFDQGGNPIGLDLFWDTTEGGLLA